MATLASQSITRAGLAPAYTAAAGGGDLVAPSEDTFLHVKNGGGSPITVTAAAPIAPFPGATAAVAGVAVPAAGERMIGPFPAQWFTDPADGMVHITYSGVTTVTVAAIQLVER